MSKVLNFKPLGAEDIEVRVTDTKVHGKATLLLYMDSRAAVRVLNDTVGQFGWQMEYHDACDGKIYGRLSIYDEEKNLWVAKEDTGEMSNIEARKGEASDILKRCLVRWGFDYLYTAPTIKIKCPDNYYLNDRLTMSFSVKSIAYSENKISQLTIVDRFNNVVFQWSNTLNMQQQPIENELDNVSYLKRYCRQLHDSGEDKARVRKFFEYYQAKANEFQQFSPERLWTKWK